MHNLLGEDIDREDIAIFLAQILQTLMDLGEVQKMTRPNER